VSVDTCPRCRRAYPTGRIGLCPGCLLEADIPAPLLGDSLELLDEIGRGGMGTVWKARHLRLGRTVAVKFLAPELAAQPDFERRLEREARALALLSHPGIVAVHDFGREDGFGYIVMEYVEGRPLSEAIPLPVDRAVVVARDILDALAYAHRHGVVHRDIKPENILLDRAGAVKITDFGIARLVGGEIDPGITSVGVLVGTPRYLAPEALAGSPPHPRMDIFAVGVVLREMLGEREANGSAPLPQALEGIIARATAVDPDQRYQTAEEMARELARFGAGGTLSDHPQGDELLPEERNWLRTVALLQTLATAVVLWAFLLSVTPKIIAPGDVQPLIMLRPERLADGRILSRARFETWPTLAAIAAIAAAVAAHGLLRRHWRDARLERPRPDQSLRESRAVLACGIVSVTVYGARVLLEGRGFPVAFAYVPILGGVIEIVALFLFWMAILQAWRNSRPLRREWPLWAGVFLALVPPVFDLATYLAAGR
jgi:eukaryotic-like serine/threonine-protein kinase